MTSFDPDTATVAEWRAAQRAAQQAGEDDEPYARSIQLFLAMADAYHFAEDSVLWPQARDLIASHSKRGNN